MLAVGAQLSRLKCAPWAERARGSWCATTCAARGHAPMCAGFAGTSNLNRSAGTANRSVRCGQGLEPVSNLKVAKTTRQPISNFRSGTRASQQLDGRQNNLTVAKTTRQTDQQLEPVSNLTVAKNIPGKPALCRDSSRVINSTVTKNCTRTRQTSQHHQMRSGTLSPLRSETPKKRPKMLIHFDSLVFHSRSTPLSGTVLYFADRTRYGAFWLVWP